MELLECVPNVSEGRDPGVIEALGDACERSLLDVHADPDHHRTVFTLLDDRPDVVAAAQALAQACLAHIDVGAHSGVHPRFGALDVVPFVGLDRRTEPAAAEAAVDFGRWLGTELGIPVFLYGAADPARRTLPAIRRAAFSTATPDFGPGAPHPTAGATAVGARRVLVALNCELSVDDVGLARTLARAVREHDGGLAGVRALGFHLGSLSRSQVSMNLVDLAATGVEAACTLVRSLARQRGVDVTRVELVGLLPTTEFDRLSDEFKAWSGLVRSQTIEARQATRG